MSNDVLISIMPYWCAMIANGVKTVEVRKTRPKQETPFRCFIYCTNSGRPLVYGDVPGPGGWTETYTQTYGYSREAAERIWDVMNGKVIGEFTCDSIEKHWLNSAGCRNLSEHSRVPADELHIYAQPNDWLLGWHISSLTIYDTPRLLSAFRKVCPNDLYCESCAMFSANTETCGNAALVLKRPPQSWCYVKEVA